MPDFKFPTPDDVSLTESDFARECERVAAEIKDGSRSVRVPAVLSKKIADMLRESRWSVRTGVDGSSVILFLSRN